MQPRLAVPFSVFEFFAFFVVSFLRSLAVTSPVRYRLSRSVLPVRLPLAVEFKQVFISPGCLFVAGSARQM